MGIFSEEEIVFYYERFPALGQAEWRETGCKAAGSVWFRLYCGEVCHEELCADVELMYVNCASHSYYSVDVGGTEYPDSGVSIKLSDFDPYVVSIDELKSAALTIALASLVDRADDIREAHAEWVQSIS